MRPSVTILARQQEMERAKKQQKARNDADFAKAVAGDLEALCALASSGYAEAKVLCRERFGVALAPYTDQPLPYPDYTPEQRARRLGVIFHSRFPTGNTAGVAAALPEYEAERAKWLEVSRVQAANPALPDFVGQAITEDKERHAATIRRGMVPGYMPGDFGYGHAAHAKMTAYLDGEALAKASWELGKQQEEAARATRAIENEKRLAGLKRAEEARIDAEARRRLAAEREEAAILARMAELREKGE